MAGTVLLGGFASSNAAGTDAPTPRETSPSSPGTAITLQGRGAVRDAMIDPAEPEKKE